MKCIDFYTHVCNYYAPAKQSDSDAKHLLGLALFIVYKKIFVTFFLIGRRSMINITKCLVAQCWGSLAIIILVCMQVQLMSLPDQNFINFMSYTLEQVK